MTTDKAAEAVAAAAPPPPPPPPPPGPPPPSMMPVAQAGYPPQGYPPQQMGYAPQQMQQGGYPMSGQQGQPGAMMMAGGGMPPVGPPRPNLPPALVSELKRLSLAGFALTMIQLLMSLAIVILVRESLEVVTVTPTTGGAVKASYVCYMEPGGGSGSVMGGPGSSCRYAYALASTSIFACFFLSLMQCLTVDCCGNGRMVETLFDFMLSIWWGAGAITLTVAKNEADAVGTPNQQARLSVVALSWASAVLFLLLGACNGALSGKLAKAKKLAMQQAQQQQQLGGGMAQGLAVSPFAPAFGGHQYVPPGGVVYMPNNAGGAPPGYPTMQPQQAGVPVAANAPAWAGGGPPAAAAQPAAAAAAPVA